MLSHFYGVSVTFLDLEDDNGDIAMRVCAELNNPKVRAKNAKRVTMPNFQSTFIIAADNKDLSEDPYFIDLKAIIDPASRHASKMGAVLNAIQTTIGQWVRIQVIFNPPAKHSELPLKSYFRYIAGDKLGETILFENIPREPLFTQSLVVPDNWMTEV